MPDEKQPDEDREEQEETPEEFAEEIESDPSRNPDDPGIDALRGG